MTQKITANTWTASHFIGASSASPAMLYKFIWKLGTGFSPEGDGESPTEFPKNKC